jgi:hypothetical protein
MTDSHFYMKAANNWHSDVCCSTRNWGKICSHGPSNKWMVVQCHQLQSLSKNDMVQAKAMHPFSIATAIIRMMEVCSLVLRFLTESLGLTHVTDDSRMLSNQRHQPHAAHTTRLAFSFDTIYCKLVLCSQTRVCNMMN